ncbi:ABC transporter permease [Microbacterium aerolatum]|uniref:ABC transporter permease n=1 Tax=Microbacterium aerolatum TaxID=153731 RepID=UPI00384CCEB1
MSTAVQTPPLPSAPATEPVARTRRALPAWFGGWELALVALVIAAVVAGSIASPFFATGQNFAITTAGAIGLALMVVPMAGLMVAGEIDLSVASVFGLAGVTFGMTLDAGIPLIGALLIGLVVGAAAGFINGWLTTAFGLPSLVVTVGTLGLYRGIAYILLENRSISRIPAEWAAFAQSNVPGTYLPYPLILFVVVAVAAGVILHRGGFGRRVFAVGSSVTASRYSGIRVRLVKRALFTFSGAVAALAGMIYTGYVASARADNGTGLELTVIAIVLIGGVSMYGGRGSMVGVILALILVIALGSWMNLFFVPTNVQNTVIGSLMIAAVVVPALILLARDRMRRTA